MADILIKGMEMPKNCIDCMFTTIDYDMCILAKNDLMLCGCRPSWCPLVPLPAGHGRLIDETELIAKLVCHCKDLRKLSTKTIGETIGLCETIVEAEGGGEDG